MISGLLMAMVGGASAGYWSAKTKSPQWVGLALAALCGFFSMIISHHFNLP